MKMSLIRSCVLCKLQQMGKMGGSPLAGLAALGLGGLGGGPNAGPVNPAGWFLPPFHMYTLFPCFFSYIIT
jgi:hypothetical protein